MAKNKKIEENVEIVVPDKVKSEEKGSKKTARKVEKKEKKSLSKKSKEVYSELKKVSWPSFSKVVKTTGIVIAVVLICTVILFLVDRLFYMLYNLLMG